MPWKVGDQVSARFEFVSRLKAGERMTDLCREYGISRKTGYKIYERFEKQGVEGLRDQSRRPGRTPWRTPEDIEQLVLAFKKKHPTWGAKKLKVELEKRNPGVHVPARSTIGLLLSRHGLVKRRRQRRRAVPTTGLLTLPCAPNDVWGIDFKGHFRLGNRRYCYPLTLSDLCSRYILGCEALDDTRVSGAQSVCEAVFREHGLPAVIRMDNGAPFASTGLWGLSRLSVWWMRLGVHLERIEPGHPEQNGRHERMHLTLKMETTRPPSSNSLAQQERFDRFCHEFNTERPHEALDMRRPAEVHRPSTRSYPETLLDLDYPLHDEVRQVRNCGHISLFGRNGSVYISSALAGQTLGLREVDDNRWLISFMTLDLGHVDLKTNRFTPLPPPTRPPRC